MNIKELTEHCKEFIQIIDKKYPIELAYLFGSRARGTENTLSDIDIALLFKNVYNSMDDAFIRGDIIELGTSFFKAPVDIVSLRSSSLALKYEIVKDGILIIETSPLIRVEFETSSIREYLDFKYYSDIYNEAILKSIKNNEYFGG